MIDGDAKGAPTTRWWLSPAVARMAFGDPTQGSRATRPTFPPSAVLEIDLSDPNQRAFGDYELIDIAGRGGMGVVYRARQRELDREVALKLLSAGNWASVEFIDSFRREAQNAARLQHPNIVVVHEMGEYGGLIYYAMQLVRGRSLSQRIDQGGPLPPREAARMLRAVAEAVDYAHRLGVLHLDLKPGNILINEDGEPLVADFGLARRLEQAPDNDIIAGTPGYMAPEQARMDGPALSPATDVWALGAVLYEMLSGHPPFEAEDPAEVLRLLLEARVRKPSRYLPVPADLEAICLKCLRQHPSARYMSARALADDLGRFLEGREVSVRPLGPLQRAWRWMQREPHLAAVAALTLVVLVAGVIATSVQWQRAENESAIARHNLWEQRRDAAGQQQNDGRGFGALPLLISNLREAEAYGERGDIEADRLRIGLLLGSSPRLIDVIALGKWITSVGISGDGELVAAGCLDGEIRLYEAATGRERWRLQTRDFPKILDDYDDIDQLVFSPDGRYLVATGKWPGPVINPSGQSMMLIDVASGRLQQPPPAFARFQDATFSADGRIALLRGTDDSAQVFRTSDWKPLGPLVRRNFQTGAWLMSGDGTRLAFWSAAGVDLLDPRTLAGRHHTRIASAWAFSPDGQWLALGDTGGEVWLVNADTGAERRLSPPPGARVRWLSFSSDGQWLVASSNDAVDVAGQAQGWDLRDGSALMPAVPLRLATSVEVDQRSGLLSVRDDNRLRLYQIVGPGSPVLSRGPALDSPGLIFGYAADVDFERGLVATGGAEGELRLWRLHDAGRVIAGRAPTAPGVDWQFDGRYLPVVDGDRAGVVDVGTNEPAGTPLRHPQPVHFAELDPTAESLVTVAGREIRRWNWRNGQLRHAPWQLPETPQRIVLSPDGQRLALTYWRPRGARAIEALRILDLARGVWLPLQPSLSGPLFGLRFSPDGARLVTWSNYPARLQLIDATAKQPPRNLALPDTTEEVRDVAFDRNGHSLYAAMAANRELSRGNTLLRWDPGSARPAMQTPFVGEPLALTLAADGSRLAIGGRARSLIDLASGELVRLPSPSGIPAFPAVALSRDGRIAAYGWRNGVHLVDARTGRPLAPPLELALADPDHITALAIAPDRGSVVARTEYGRWLLWPLPTETRPLSAIAAETELLSGGARDYGAPMSSPLPASAREVLRGRDPGTQAIQVPMLATAKSLPARGRDLPASLLDLSRYYTGPLFDPQQLVNDAPDLGQVPVGPQRLLGVDYDVRGMIYLSAESFGDDLPPRRGNIRVGQHAAALHVLATSQGRSQTRRPVELARIVLNYSDGSRARLPLAWSREFAASWDDPNDFPQPQLAWFRTPDYGWGGDGTSLFVMRLRNPYPERRIESLDLETTQERWSRPVFVAITIEPPATSAPLAAAGGAPVRRK
ncbi:protein kinase [Lysobacter niabensis]|uniref:WD40 repeat domain-containing serine/threonine protein kinase n=1 Tax=Agrilutibacter niabensis TaxID=380628 RepID=UPI00360D974B